MIRHLPGKESGASLVEILISLGLLTAVITAIGVKVQSMRKVMSTTSQLMSADALEGSLMNFLGRESVILHSITQAGTADLQNCALKGGPCKNQKIHPLPLYREGQTKPFTGNTVFYDFNGNICTDRCSGFQILTSVETRCNKGTTCTSFMTLVVTAEIFETGRKEPIRRIGQAVEKFSNGLFPDLQISCANSSSFLRGIGINGDALCVPSSDVVYQDPEKRALTAELRVTPKDCSSLNVAPTDQHYVSAFDAVGNIVCSPRFW